MQIFGKFYSTSSTRLELEENPDRLQILSADLGGLYNNKKCADVEIACGTETFYAHKAIMCGEINILNDCTM